MKAVGYVRVSTELQAGPDTYGLDAQRDAIEAFAQANGIELVEWFGDEGISGADMGRPGLADALEAAKADDVGAVLVAKLDRAARDLFGQLYIENELKRSDARLVSAAEPFGNDDPQSRLMRQMLGAFAEFEKSLIRARLEGGRKAKAKRGGYAGGRPALGYTVKDARLEVDRRGSAAVRRLFEIKNHRPGWSLRKVAALLNEEGYQTTEGGKFYAQTVKRVLGRESLYAGAYQYAGIKANGQHTAIL